MLFLPLVALATTMTAVACGSDSTTGTTSSTATSLSVVSGSGQSANISTALSAPFTVKVVNATGSGISGIAVTWAISSGGGSLSTSSSTTDANGLASTTYTTGTTVGTSTVTANAAGLVPVTFSTTVTALPTSTPAAISVVSGAGQTAPAGTALASPFVVKVVNGSGTAVSGVNVAWAITSGGGSLSATSSSTDANGQASVTYTAGTTVGTSTVTATVTGLTAVTFSAAVTTATASGNCAAQTTNAGTVACLAAAYVATLSATQQAATVLPFTQANAIKWSNLPCGNSCRNGVQFSTLTATQLSAALAVAQAAASAAGYTTFDVIRKADTFLGQTSPGGYNEGIYFIAFLGTPSATGTWMLQYGGHHYAINMMYNGGTVASSVTPNFVGVEPQSFTLNGTTYAPLNTRRDAMYGMIQSLDAATLASAKLTTAFSDVLLGPGQDGKFPTQQGVLVSSLTTAQQALVKTAIEAWVNDAPTALAATLLADYESATAFASTRISWAGATTPTVQGSYVRIDGPKVWIEFVCQNGVVFPSQIHFHTIWRDKSRDYGGSFTF